MSVHKTAKMLQESYPPALTILRGYIPVWTQYIQKVILVYDGILHTSYMGCTDRHTWKWHSQIISSAHVQGMCMYIHSMNVYMQCMYMVHTGFNQLFQQETDDRLGRRQLWRKGAGAELRLACVARLIGPDATVQKSYRKWCVQFQTTPLVWTGFPAVIKHSLSEHLKCLKSKTWNDLTSANLFLLEHRMRSGAKRVEQHWAMGI